MNARKKRFGVFCAVLLLVTVTASALFMAFGVSHACSGADCAVCRDLALLRGASGAFGACALLSAVCAFSGPLRTVCGRICAAMRESETPISQKVKLTQ